MSQGEIFGPELQMDSTLTNDKCVRVPLCISRRARRHL